MRDVFSWKHGGNDEATGLLEHRHVLEGRNIFPDGIVQPELPLIPQHLWGSVTMTMADDMAFAGRPVNGLKSLLSVSERARGRARERERY